MGISKEYSKWSDIVGSGWFNVEPKYAIVQSYAICVTGSTCTYALSLSNDLILS